MPIRLTEQYARQLWRTRWSAVTIVDGGKWEWRWGVDRWARWYQGGGVESVVVNHPPHAYRTCIITMRSWPLRQRIVAVAAHRMLNGEHPPPARCRQIHVNSFRLYRVQFKEHTLVCDDHDSYISSIFWGRFHNMIARIDCQPVFTVSWSTHYWVLSYSKCSTVMITMQKSTSFEIGAHAS